MWLVQGDYFEQARIAKARVSAEYLQSDRRTSTILEDTPNPYENVVGVGLGPRIIRGYTTGELCVKVYVRRKFPKSQIKQGDLLPSGYDGIRLDVEEAGLLETFEAELDDILPNPMVSLDPLQPGTSVGGCACSVGGTGTIAAIAADRAGRRFALTCAHVIKSTCGHAEVFHPGVADAAQDGTARLIGRVAHLAAAVPDAVNDIDAGSILLSVAADPKILYIGGPTDQTIATRGMLVHKFGRTSRYTYGLVTDPEFDVNLYSRRQGAWITYVNQIRIEPVGMQPFSASGDSGALVLEAATNRAIGVLLGGGPPFSVANHLFRVLEGLGLMLVTA
ncbi:MAG: hypothetical protein JO036_11705 [Candidatus Eremiobacteraeota bacterium]|nr:hypothetical protein [Candidatus Eremiobacteraeota bacterium]